MDSNQMLDAEEEKEEERKEEAADKKRDIAERRAAIVAHVACHDGLASQRRQLYPATL